MADLLFSLAEAANVCSICIVVFCFIIMVLFIIRLRSDDIETPVLQPGLHVPMISMVPVQNPFVFSIDSEECTISPDALWCVIDSQESCHVYIFWGVSIPDLFSEIRKPWLLNKEKLSKHQFLDGESSLFMNNALHFESCSQQRIHLKYPDTFTPEALGPMPRCRYPLVVLITIGYEDNGTLDHVEDPARIVALINIVHLKDSLCPLKSGIFAQYLKRADGLVCSLKPLFMATESSSQEDNNSLDSSAAALYEQVEETNNKDCVVCQNASIMRVVLPCRHFCVCDNCFTYLDKCPICRGNIDSYFRIEHLQTNNDNEDQLSQEQPSFATKWQRWNESLNKWLGFN